MAKRAPQVERVCRTCDRYRIQHDGKLYKGDAKIPCSASIVEHPQGLCVDEDLEHKKLRGLPADEVFADEEGCNGGTWWIPIFHIVIATH